MDASAGVWFCGTGSDVVIFAYYMTAKCTEGYRYREANGDFPIGIEFSGISQSLEIFYEHSAFLPTRFLLYSIMLSCAWQHPRRWY